MSPNDSPLWAPSPTHASDHRNDTQMRRQHKQAQAQLSQAHAHACEHTHTHTGGTRLIAGEQRRRYGNRSASIWFAADVICARTPRCHSNGCGRWLRACRFIRMMSCCNGARRSINETTFRKCCTFLSRECFT